ncbi:MAG: leucyl aminopeptidase family protein [Alphaproteobacteria bacterium]
MTRRTPLGLADSEDTAPATPLHVVAADGLEAWAAARPQAVRDWIARIAFAARPGDVAVVPDGADGALALVGDPAGAEGDRPLRAFGAAPAGLPAGRYRLDHAVEPGLADRLALGWALGAYGFDRYTARKRAPAELVWPATADRAAVTSAALATDLARDLINTPAEDMGPSELAAAAEALADDTDAAIRVIVGDDLLSAGFPLIHAVGRACDDAPRLIDLRWGDEAAPKVTLVGKGVCFDSGGLDLKPSSAMLTMKKDMGGAANVLALARMVIDAALPVRLRVLIPAVENSVSGNAFRPLDIVRSRAGITVEVGNTDAEGRLVLCDAIALACEEGPQLIVDMATLTGAARVALGTELPALFCNDDGWAAAFVQQAAAVHDPLWRMPLYAPYRKLLDTKIADTSNISDGPYGGAITAALFLEKFVTPGVAWAHIDLMAWNPSDQPGRPKGGEAQGPRALFAALQARYRPA